MLSYVQLSVIRLMIFVGFRDGAAEGAHIDLDETIDRTGQRPNANLAPQITTDT